jgi:hypothetical protein
MLASFILALALAMPNATTSTAYEPDPAERGDTSSAPDTSETASFDLQAHQWEHRVLLVFAPSRENEHLETQAARVEAARDGFVERHLVVAELVADGKSQVQHEPGGDFQPVADDEAAALRDRFGVDGGDFAVVLVGKDGTEKRRSELPMATKDLFATIDAMPMRQREMAEGDG